MTGQAFCISMGLFLLALELAEVELALGAGNQALNVRAVTPDDACADAGSDEADGEIIAVGEGYKAKATCLNGIDSIRRNAPDAEVVKLED